MLHIIIKFDTYVENMHRTVFIRIYTQNNIKKPPFLREALWVFAFRGKLFLT